MEGELKGDLPPGVTVRAIEEQDYETCAELCRKTHGFARLNELRKMPPFLTSFVAIRDGRLTAYTSAPQFWPLNHAVAETEEDMQSLLLGAGNLSPISFCCQRDRRTFFVGA